MCRHKAERLAPRQIIQDRLASLNDKKTEHISLRSDWQLLEGDLRKYLEILSDNRFAVKTNIFAMRDDILQAAIVRLRKLGMQQDMVGEDEIKLELQVKEVASGSELLNTDAEHQLTAPNG